jgi:preprotein translocase subunit SecA
MVEITPPHWFNRHDSQQGPYSMASIPKYAGLDHLLINLFRPVVGIKDRFTLPLKTLAQRVGAFSANVQRLTDIEILVQARQWGMQVRNEGIQSEATFKLFALIREVASRQLNMPHHDVQLLGGYVLLKGMLAEMDTGEGKTLTATLAAATIACTGVPVHVITVNDYLAQRDAQMMRPIYEGLGLSVGTVVAGMSPEERRQAYSQSVCYCTNKEIVFDYLRDRVASGATSRLRTRLNHVWGGAKPSGLMLRGLFFGIVDEADSVLIDEARTPLILSEKLPFDAEEQLFKAVMAWISLLSQGDDFVLRASSMTSELTNMGETKLRNYLVSQSELWPTLKQSRVLVERALTAVYHYKQGVHYIIADGKIKIVDEYTGRTMEDRTWERGLHQLIEVKERVPVTQPNRTLDKISYQRFFGKYLHLAGMSGTVKEVSDELWSVYRLKTMKIPTHRPCIRQNIGTRIFLSKPEKWEAVISRIATMADSGRPVLVGTRSVASSEELSSQLSRLLINHQLLNAHQDEDEAVLVSQAGLAGKITVATNMAGRGTDIAITRDVAEKGGLHVIATEIHDSRRIDRQLFGRCARQGDPGAYEILASLEDDLINTGIPIEARLLIWIARYSNPFFSGLCHQLVLRFTQRMLEIKHTKTRNQLLKSDEQWEQVLKFAQRGH